jgi:DNA-binding transcriptional ArsR family regulator
MFLAGDPMETRFADFERLFLGLGDKTRLRLIALMANGPVSVGYLVEHLGESQPKVSRHLAYLRGTGLVETSRDGKWVYYGIAEAQEPGCEAVMRTVLAELVGPSRSPKKRDLPMANASSDHADVPKLPGANTEDSFEENYDEYEEYAGPLENTSNELEIFLL